MVENFADSVARTPKPYFAEIVKESLFELLGESVSLAVIYHLGGAEALQDPKVFENKIKAIFDKGAKIILENILKNLETFSEDTEITS